MQLPFDEGDESGGYSSDDTLASTVLVVDDERSVCDFFTRLLAAEQDLTVSTADSAEAALVLLKQSRFDLLVADKNLPQLGGMQLIAAAREIRPSMAALMVTGFASAESVIAAFAAGASDYLLKPFDELAVVRAKVRAALERRGDRTRAREISRQLAAQAQELLGRGKSVTDDVWDALERQLAQYERTVRLGAIGKVVVLGRPDTLEHIRSAGEADGVDVTLAEPDAAEVSAADVVVLDTARKDWRVLADRLLPGPADVLLVARQQADLSDLIEAIALRADIVGFGGGEHGALRSRLRALLMRRTVQRAHGSLSDALREFHRALVSSPSP